MYTLTPQNIVGTQLFQSLIFLVSWKPFSNTLNLKKGIFDKKGTMQQQLKLVLIDVCLTKFAHIKVKPSYKNICKCLCNFYYTLIIIIYCIIDILFILYELYLNINMH